MLMISTITHVETMLTHHRARLLVLSAELADRQHDDIMLRRLARDMERLSVSIARLHRCATTTGEPGL